MLTGVLLLAFGCQVRDSRREYLARVGDTYLTREELQTSTDSTVLASESMTKEYVARWVDDEILYQEARRQGLEQSQAVQHQLADARKQLVIEALLQKEIYKDAAYVPEDSIQAYFDQHQGDFVMQDNAVKLNMVAFGSREQANAFRAAIVGGESWSSTTRSLAEDSTTARNLLTRIGGRVYTQHTLFPPELWRVAMSLTPGEVSFPVRTQGGVFVLQVLTVFRQGSLMELDMVRDEIRQRLIMDRRRREYGDLLARLRSRYSIDLSIP